MTNLNRDQHSFKKQPCLTCFLFATGLLVIVIDLTSAWITDGLCAEPLGFAVNNYLDGCMRNHHYFSAMRAYSLKNLYKINCCPGYREISRRGRDEELKCQAICASPCRNGACVKPDTCQCNVGHYLRSKYECNPICHPSCKNGQCVGIDECKCNPGYRMITGSSSECEPIYECVNGHCKGPGLCECSDGYKFESGSNWKCVPECDPPCTNGVCSSPNVCQCLLGYSKDSDNSCKPLCHSGCGMGNCSTPDTCSCPTGYEALPGQTCRPICSECSGGTCVSPGVCHCPNGRTLDEKAGKCVRVCDPPCVNGDCVDPGKCICKEGFSMDNKSGFCEPVCSPICTNGRCVKPGHCECQEGYRMKSSSDTECEPICTNPCINGSCVAPEICQCWEGYVKVSNNSCSPICFNGCGPGTCIFPNNCLCPAGYEAIDGGSCQPVCSEPCDNGICIEPDVCVCSKGYSLDESSGNCELAAKICKDCVNGLCVSSDTCKCFPRHNMSPEEPFFCLPELGEYTSGDPTLFLNVLHMPSALRYLEDNETFTFAKLPTFTVRKHCNFLFHSTNMTSNVTALLLDYVQLNCAPLESDSELNIKLYCQWPLEESEVSSSGVNSTSGMNSTSVQSITFKERQDLWNFSLSLEFPKTFADGEDGYCTMCVQSPIRSRYFSVNGLDDLLLAPCNHEPLIGITSTLEGEMPLMWIAIGCGFVIILILLTAGIIIVTVKSLSRNKYHKTETIDADEFSKISSRKITSTQYCHTHGTFLLKEHYVDDDNCTSNHVTEC